jgi:hypothetical protein
MEADRMHKVNAETGRCTCGSGVLLLEGYRAKTEEGWVFVQCPQCRKRWCPDCGKPRFDCWNSCQNVVRFERLAGTRAEKRRQMKDQLEKFDKAAKAGRVICLSDIIGNAESLHADS